MSDGDYTTFSAPPMLALVWDCKPLRANYCASNRSKAKVGRHAVNHFLLFSLIIETSRYAWKCPLAMFLPSPGSSGVETVRAYTAAT